MIQWTCHLQLLVSLSITNHTTCASCKLETGWQMRKQAAIEWQREHTVPASSSASLLPSLSLPLSNPFAFGRLVLVLGGPHIRHRKYFLARVLWSGPTRCLLSAKRSNSACDINKNLLEPWSKQHKFYQSMPRNWIHKSKRNNITNNREYMEETVKSNKQKRHKQTTAHLWG